MGKLVLGEERRGWKDEGGVEREGGEEISNGREKKEAEKWEVRGEESKMGRREKDAKCQKQEIRGARKRKM